MAVIRPPLMEDYEQLNELGRWFQENSAYAKCGWSEKKFKSIYTSSLKEDSPYFVRVAEEDGDISGVFFGLITEYFFSNEKIAMDQVVCFHPEKRKNVGKSLIRMFKEFESWAKERGAHECCIGVTSEIAGDGYEKLIERVGYRNVGSVYKREV
jgi:hypothetical protein